MRACMVLVIGIVLSAALSGCHKPPKLTPEDAAIATETTAEMSAATVAVTNSRYRTYRWMTAEEMVQSRLGYDPTMSSSTRYEVEQAIDDDLSQKGYQESQPADFVVAFNDVYIDRNRSAPGGAFEGPSISITEGVNESQMEAYSDMEIYRSPEETFTILFLDAKTRRLLWRGRGKEVLGDAQSPEKIESAVFNALDDMPQPLAP